MKVFVLILGLILIESVIGCTPSITRVTGSQAPKGRLCSGDIIFEDNFQSFDQNKWLVSNTLAGGGNWEFQWYPGYDATNLFVKNGVLHLAPTKTADVFGENFLTSGHATIKAEECTETKFYGCDRQGTPENILNPIRSARVDTKKSFGFVYGELEVRAEASAGDW